MYEYYNYEDRAEMARQEEIKRREQEKAKTEKKAKRRKWLSTIAMAVVFGLIAGGIFISVNYVNDRFFGNRTEQIAQTSPSDRESKKEKEIGQTEKAEEVDEAGDAAKSEDKEQNEPAQINKSQGVYSEQVSQVDGTVNSVSAVAKEAM
ncbi:MAG: hypothetical protein IJU25_06120, partial [Lachnospiraceae bacterium]|nr:hypothetical protein [Lachnospiraceae bacterium]